MCTEYELKVFREWLEESYENEREKQENEKRILR